MAIVQTNRGPISMENAKAVLHSPSLSASAAKAFGYFLVGAALLPIIVFVIFLGDVIKRISGQAAQLSNGSWTEYLILFGVSLIYAYFPVKAGLAFINWRGRSDEISEKIAREPMWHLFWITLACVGLSLSIEAMASLYTPYTGTTLTAWVLFLAFEGILFTAIRTIGLWDVRISYADGSLLKVRNLRYPDVAKLTGAVSLGHENPTNGLS